jgi:hypothetical protein
MAHLADEWAEQRQQCVDVLCAYLRLPWAGNPTQLEPNTTTTEHSWPDGEGQRKCEREVRQTLVRVIASHLRSDTGSITGPASAGRTWISTSQTRPCQTPTFVKPTSAAGTHTDGRPSGARLLRRGAVLGCCLLRRCAVLRWRFLRRESPGCGHDEVRGADSRQRWIRTVDLRPGSSSEHPSHSR